MNNAPKQIMIFVMDRNTIFISDLHLSNTTPETTQLFFEFAAKITPTTDALYILGDLFQFWIGDDDHSPFNEQIKTVLKQISSKIPVYLMSGNRDFLLGKKFAQESGCTLISDPCLIDLYGKKTLLTHGDTLTKDIKYRLFRTIIRFPYGLKLFLKFPLSFRFWLASNIQKYCTKTRRLKYITAVQPDITKNLLTRFNSTQIIHGHIHVEEIEDLVINNQKARRISLGDWDKKGNILIYFDIHDFRFENILIMCRRKKRFSPEINF